MLTREPEDIKFPVQLRIFNFHAPPQSHTHARELSVSLSPSLSLRNWTFKFKNMHDGSE